MRFLGVLFFVLSSSTVFAGSDLDVDYAKKVYESVLQEIHELRYQYTLDDRISRSELQNATRNIYKICDLKPDSTSVSDHQMRPIAPAALQYWKELIHVVMRHSLTLKCRQVLLYSLQPAPWDENTWDEMRRWLDQEGEPVELGSVSTWTFPLIAIASRAEPKKNPIPEDIKDSIKKFLQILWNDGRPVVEQDELPSFDDLIAGLKPMGVDSQKAKKDLKAFIRASENVTDLAELKLVSLRKKRVQAGTPRLSLYEMMNPTDQPKIDVIARGRGLVLGLEALRPGSVIREHRKLAGRILYKEDRKEIRRARRLSNCESNLR